MDARPDPLGVCIHRSSLIDAPIQVNLSRPSASQKNNAIDSSVKDMDLGQTIPCSAGSVQGNVLHNAGSIFGGSTSTIRPDADRSSRALTPPKVFTLSKRSRSCNDLVEPSPTVTRIYSQKSGALRPKDPNLSWTNNFRETDVDGHPSNSQSHKSPGLPHRGPTDSKPIKTEDHSPSQEIRDVKTHVVHDRLTQLEKDEAEPTQVLLGLSPPIQPINEPRVSVAVSRTPRETKKIKKEDDEVTLAAGCKTPKNGTGDVGTAIYIRDVVDEAGALSHHVTLEIPPSSFDASEWSRFYWSPTVFTPQHHPPSSRTSVDTSGYTERSDGQVNIRPKPTRSAASPSNSPDGSEDLDHLDISPSHKPRKSAASSSNSLERPEDLNIDASPFISALDMFNKIVPNCDSKKIRPNIDAMERFHRDPNKCLGNTQKGRRCCNPIRSQHTKAIGKVLTKLAAEEFENNTQICVTELLKLIKMAVCHQQREKIKDKVSLLVAPDILEEEAIKVKAKELPGRILMNGESRTTGGRKEQAVVSSVTLLTSNITYRWAKSPKSASSYPPNYLPYRTEVFRKSDVSKWVMQQAEKPLTRRELDPGYLYVYWNQASFGVYKIGYSCDVDERLRSWEGQCKHVAEEQYRSPHEVRNVRRLERLVHAELKKYRVQEHGCHGCSKSHKEWFKGVGFKTILESIESWTEWIMKEDGPYEEVDGEWLLKEDAEMELQQLCNMLSVVKAEESKAKPRRNLRPRMAKRSSSSYSRGYW